MNKFNVALVGQPNCGKSSLFNILTNNKEKVGNFPGVTVDLKFGKLLGHTNIDIVDLPGLYSLNTLTNEEKVAFDFITKDKPNLIVNVIDATNLERSLFLTLQLLEFNIPIVLVLNMSDILERRNIFLNEEKLSLLLNMPALKVSSLEETGINKLISTINELVSIEKFNSKTMHFSDKVEHLLLHVKNELDIKFPESQINNWTALQIISDYRHHTKELSGFDKTEEIKNMIHEIEYMHDEELSTIIIDERYEYINKIVSQATEHSKTYDILTRKIDKILTNKFFSFPIFLIIIAFVYYVSITLVGQIFIDPADAFFNDVVLVNLNNFLAANNLNGFIADLLVNGILAGIFSIILFIPQIFSLFFLLSILEDIGYMSRVAFILDKLFRKIGLSGKSSIPLVIGSGCSVPGIMATRTIENNYERKMTIALTPFIPCGAKLPVFAMFIAAFFSASFWVAPSIYVVAILVIIISGLLGKLFLKKNNKQTETFIIEMPDYKFPKIKRLLSDALRRTKSFAIRAGRVIIVGSVILWLTSSYNFQLQPVADPSQSILAMISGLLAPLFAPLGFGSWEAVSAFLAGFIAKESIVSTFAVLYSGSSTNVIEAIQMNFNAASAYSFMIFTLLSAPCIASIAAIKEEMNDMKWTIGTIIFQFLTAYLMAFLAYNFLLLFI